MPTHDELMRLADRLHRVAVCRAGGLFTEKGHMNAPSIPQHERSVAYAANLFTIAASLKARATGKD